MRMQSVVFLCRRCGAPAGAAAEGERLHRLPQSAYEISVSFPAAFLAHVTVLKTGEDCNAVGNVRGPVDHSWKRHWGARSLPWTPATSHMYGAVERVGGRGGLENRRRR
eukprot:IDg848t1